MKVNEKELLIAVEFYTFETFADAPTNSTKKDRFKLLHEIADNDLMKFVGLPLRFKDWTIEEAHLMMA